MPADFDKCVRNGGRVRTVKGKQYGCKEGQYRHICFLHGESYLGEVKTKQKENK